MISWKSISSENWVPWLIVHISVKGCLINSIWLKWTFLAFWSAQSNCLSTWKSSHLLFVELDLLVDPLLQIIQLNLRTITSPHPIFIILLHFLWHGLTFSFCCFTLPHSFFSFLFLSSNLLFSGYIHSLLIKCFLKMAHFILTACFFFVFHFGLDSLS